MSLGYGVGDVLAISQLAARVYSAYKDAPDEYRRIADEVRSLHIIINKAASHFESTPLSSNSRQEGQEVLQGCRNVLEDLDTLLVKYNSLVSANTSQVLQRFKFGNEDIATIRARLTSNTTLLSSFIQSCDSHKLDELHERLNSVLGLRRTVSRDSIVSLVGSVNTKKAYKKFIKGLIEIGVTADMIGEKEKEILDILKPPASNQIDDSALMDQSQLLEEKSSDATESPIFPTFGNQGQSSPISAISKSQSRFRWARPPIDFLVGPRVLAAAEAGDTQLLASTLGYIRNIDFTDTVGRTALHKAALNGHEDIVRLLLTAGASVDFRDKWDNTPLHCAAQSGNINMVELLLTKGASVESIGFRHETPLHKAAKNSHTNTAELLLTKGAPIDAIDNDNNTPLHDAARNGYTSTVELLLTKGASIEALGDCSETPLHKSAMNGHTNTVRLLLMKGASVEAPDKYNNTALHRAAGNGHTGTVERILMEGASIEAENSFRETPLYKAAMGGHINTVELLLTKGASVNAQDCDNDTPLHDAARFGRTRTVELLLAKGASVEAINNQNHTPLDLATSRGHIDTVKLLEKRATEAGIPEETQTGSGIEVG